MCAPSSLNLAPIRPWPSARTKGSCLHYFSPSSYQTNARNPAGGPPLKRPDKSHIIDCACDGATMSFGVTHSHGAKPSTLDWDVAPASEVLRMSILWTLLRPLFVAQQGCYEDAELLAVVILIYVSFSERRVGWSTTLTVQVALSGDAFGVCCGDPCSLVRMDWGSWDWAMR